MKGTRQLVNDLVMAGFQVTEGHVANLIRHGHVPSPAIIGRNRVFTEADERRVVRVLLDTGRGPRATA